MSSTVSSQAAKRRQLHPLRQTSFPAAQFPSVIDSAVTPSARSEAGSTFSATSSRVPGRGRGRPKKDRPLPSQEPDGASQTGKSRTGKSAAKSVVSARSGPDGAGAGGRGEAGSEVDEEEESDDEHDVEVPADEAEKGRAEDRLRSERERRLASTLEGDAQHRYTVSRSLTIDKKTIRKVINAIMSQSAADKVVSAIQFTSKLYVGALIELARDVQKEWADAYDETKEVEKKWRSHELARLKAQEEKGRMDEKRAILVKRDIARLEKATIAYIPNPHRGGILPDHLREAVRRYKADGEAKSAGDTGSAYSLLGVPGSAAARLSLGSGGRRMFR